MSRASSQPYFISYGQIQTKVFTLTAARREARKIAKNVMYEVSIVHKGDVMETLTPKVLPSGRVVFTTIKSS